MKTIHISIFKELVLVFLLGLLAFNFVLVTERMLKLTRAMGSMGASFSDMALIILYLQPMVAVLTTPLAMLIGVLVTFGRLNADNEIVILRSSGMSFFEISRPAFLLGFACFAATAALSFSVAPVGAAKTRTALAEMTARRAPLAIEEGIFNTSFRDLVIFVSRKTGAETMEGIFIHDDRKKERPVILYAARGRLSSTGGELVSLELGDGHIYVVRGDSITDLAFGRYRLEVAFASESPARKIEELSPVELYLGSRTEDPNARVKLLLELHRRLSLPSLCLILALLGPPLALMAGKTGRLGGLTLGIVVFAAYYSALMYGEKLAFSGAVPHYAGAWAPALALLALSLWLFLREAKR